MMAVNFSTEVYRPCFDVFSVRATFHPVFSQPDGESFNARGIYDTDEIDVVAENGSMFIDQKTIFDIRTAEFTILPQQHDRVTIPFDCNGAPLGTFEIVDVTNNGGGEATLVLKRWTSQLDQ